MYLQGVIKRSREERSGQVKGLVEHTGKKKYIYTYVVRIRKEKIGEGRTAGGERTVRKIIKRGTRKLRKNVTNDSHLRNK